MGPSTVPCGTPQQLHLCFVFQSCSRASYSLKASSLARAVGSFFWIIFSSLWRTDVINASILLSGELCLLVCFTSQQLMLCVRQVGGLMGEMRGEKWWGEGWRIREARARDGWKQERRWEGRGERWMNERWKEGKNRKCCGQGGQEERWKEKDKWRTGGAPNDLHTTPNL